MNSKNPAYKRNLSQLTDNLRDESYIRRWFDQVGYEVADLIEELQKEAIDLAQSVTERDAEIAYRDSAMALYEAVETRLRTSWREDTAQLASEIAALKAAMRASFDEHGSAPTDCDYSKCTRLAVLLDYLPVVNDGHP